jgi:hypothetical protein
VDSTTFDIVLFLHIVVAIAAFMVAGILHAGLLAMRRATTTSQLKGWLPTIARLEPVFPVLALVLFGLGAWLLHLSGGEFRWSNGWVITAVVSLAIVEIIGGAVMAPASKAMAKEIEEAPEGAVSDQLRGSVLNPKLWTSGHLNTAAVLGIVCLMVTKPSGVISVVVVLVAAALGALSARPFLSAPVPAGAAEGARIVTQRQPADHLAPESQRT